MAKFSIMYIAVCEFIFAVMMGCVGGFLLFSGDRLTNTYLSGFGLVMIAALSLWGGFSMVWKRRWAWNISLIVGIMVVAVSVLIIWLAANADPHGDGGEAAIFGIGFLLFALPGFIILSLRSTRRYLSVTGL